MGSVGENTTTINAYNNLSDSSKLELFDDYRQDIMKTLSANERAEYKKAREDAYSTNSPSVTQKALAKMIQIRDMATKRYIEKHENIIDYYK